MNVNAKLTNMDITKTLGRYQIETFLGKGAFAEVYKAVDTMLQRTVALKVLKPALMADEEALSRFTREAQVLASLVHPRIAWVWDMGGVDGRFFIAMRYVDGKSLDKVLAGRGALGRKEVLKITGQVAEALEFAHGQGLIHRDVKPQNILFSEKEGAILTDFGLVKAMQSSGITSTGSHLGTPRYMAPELWDGQEASPASDQYALACLIVEMLTGKILFDGNTPVVIRKHLVDQPVLPPGLPENVAAGLRRALAKSSAARFESIHAFVEALQAIPQERKPNPQTQKSVSNKGIDKQVALSIDNELIVTLAEGIQMVFVRISTGEFLMGTGSSSFLNDEGPQHKVHLNEYWMGKAPVTNTQYLAFVSATGKLAPRYWKDGKIPEGKEQHPVTNVTWDDARAFCQWATQQTGETIHLPSEAEWEKAARGPLGRTYPWGEQKPDKDLCNFNSNVEDTSPIGNYSPAGDSPYGCVDMAGNVWQWTSSLYQKYPYRAGDGREVETGRKERMLRGGSWSIKDLSVRSAYRFRSYPSYADDNLGFRCSRSP